MSNNSDKSKEQLINDNNLLKDKIFELEKSIKQLDENFIDINKDKIDFFKNISHNLRISLNGIIGMTEMLKQTSVNEIQKDYIKVISNSSNSLLNSINKIFNFFLIENKSISIENKKFNIKELLNESINHFIADAKEKNINLKFAIDEKIPESLNGDSNHLTQIIYDLLSVYIFNSKDGNIIIELNHIETENNNNNQKIKFDIINNCIALNNEKIKAVIESETPINPFPDSLIGINIINSKKIIDFFNGSLNHEFKSESKSKFTFTLLFDKILENSKPIKMNEAKKNISKKTNVLVVEDNMLNRKFASAILKKAGYNFDLAENGKIGIEKFKENNFDIILMDIQMPIMDGLMAAKKIREIEKEKNTKNKIIIVAVTAYALENDKKNCLEAGMDYYISKPYKPNELREVIEKFC